MIDNSQNFEDWLGRKEIHQLDMLTPRLCCEFAVTFGNAVANIQGAAPGISWCLAPQLADASELGPDGHPAKGGFLPPVALPRRMWAGGVLEFSDPLLPGDTVAKTSTIKDITRKTGKSGDLCFVTVTHDYATVRGLAISEDHNIVYRAAATGPMRADTPLATTPKFDAEIQVDITPTMLFRYSAMTFNGHRIHYDLPYAQQTEFYPDLVIHGPLQATLLLNLATSVKSSLPKRFEFRGTAPATGAQTMQFGATISGNSCELMAVSEDNTVTMTAKAEW